MDKRHKMHPKRTPVALIVIAALHALIAAVCTLYLLNRTPTFKELIDPNFRAPQPPPARQTTEPAITAPNRPQPSSDGFLRSADGHRKPRRAVSGDWIPGVDFQSRVYVYATYYPRLTGSRLLTLFPKTFDGASGARSKDLFLPDAPDSLSFSTPVMPVPVRHIGSPVKRGSEGTERLKPTIGRPAGLSMLEHVGAVQDALANVVKQVSLGNEEVPPLPPGVPGGRVVGRGKDIRGVFRFSCVRHCLSDWWTDPSSLNDLAAWLNHRTKIKTDLNVTGGSLKLTDADLMKSPLIVMTGHDPAMLRAYNLMGAQYGGGMLDSKLPETEIIALRKYLVEKGGFLFFDDCGVNAPAQAMVRLFLAQMRRVMPEHHIERIPNNHEVYNNFYMLGGPPMGFNVYWWGARPPNQPYLEGISVGGKLSVLISRRDYLCAMRSISLPGFGVQYSPGVYRFMTNVAVYSLTHGGISDYSDYVPESRFQDRPLPRRAPQVARIRAIE